MFLLSLVDATLGEFHEIVICHRFVYNIHTYLHMYMCVELIYLSIQACIYGEVKIVGCSIKQTCLS